MLRLALPFWRGMALATLLGALTIGSSVSLMATSAWLISKAALQPSVADLGVAIVGVRFFGIARGVFRYLERLVAHDTTFRLLAHLRVEFYKAMEPLAPARLIAQRSGDLLSRVIDDMESLQDLYLRAVAPPLVALLVGAALTLFLVAVRSAGRAGGAGVHAGGGYRRAAAGVVGQRALRAGARRGPRGVERGAGRQHSGHGGNAGLRAGAGAA